MLTKYALVAIIVLCCTVLGFTLMVNPTNRAPDRAPGK